MVGSQVDDFVDPPNTAVTVATQTDLITTSLQALQDDNQGMTTKLAEVHVGYPCKKDLQANKKLLHFYTGLSSFTALVAVTVQAL